MAYCKKADVENLLSQRDYDSDSEPASLQLENIIDNVAALIDSRLGAIGFTVPVTGDSSLAVLKIINALGAAGLAEKSTVTGVESADEQAKTFWELYEKEMERIEAKPLILSDAEFTVDGATHPGSNLSSLYQDYPSTLGLDPRFEIAEKF